MNLAIRQYNEWMVSNLLIYGGTPIIPGELSYLPPKLAIRVRSLPIVKQLLIHEAIVKDPSNKEEYPLRLARSEYYVSRDSCFSEPGRVKGSVIGQLIKNNWGCAILRKEFISIFTLAVDAGRFEAAQQLVARRYQGNNYKFPNEALPLLKELLRHGLPFSSSLIEVWSACKPGGIDILTMASQYGNTEVLKQILRGDLKVDMPKSFRSPLMTAIRYR